MAHPRDNMLSALRADNSPFSEQQLASLQQSVGGLDAAQAQWLSGYLAGRLEATSPLVDAPAADTASGAALTILYGSETGNGEGLAERLAETARQAGLAVELFSLDGFRPAQLKKHRAAVFILSTHGEGDPPEEAQDLFEYLDGERAPRLADLRYRVLALGDRSYQMFCAAGRHLDERLEALGAQRFGQRVDCDVDYGSSYEAWAAEVIAWSHDTLGGSPAPAKAHLRVVPSAPRWDHDIPFEAEVVRAQKITGSDSEKDVYHLELSLEGAGLTYEPGDALGVWASNDPDLVRQVLDGAGVSHEAMVSVRGRDLTLREALIDYLEITRLTPDIVRAFTPEFDGLESAAQRAFMEQRQLADLVAEFPRTWEAQALADLLRPLSPRSYSIASSQALVDEEAHLTVATLHSNAIGIERNGVASHHLNHGLGAGDSVRVFPEANRRFRLPADRATPLIMIGAGTGIAPYRAFLQQLEAEGATPDTWLLFGNPHLRSDFLYQREILHWRSSELLGRIDAAWSRDQADKRYIQHVVAEQIPRISRWLERGAQIYLCGSLAMGRAVQEALRGVAARQQIHKDLY